MDNDNYDHELDQDTETEPEKKYTGEEIIWEGQEYEFAAKTADWFWILGTIAVLAAIIAFILGDYLFGLIIIIASYILGTQAKRPPRLTTYGLTRHGIKVGETLFRYNSIKSFWLNRQKNTLIIESGRWIKPHVHIPLAETNPDNLRHALIPLVKEQEYNDSISDVVTEFFGF